MLHKQKQTEGRRKEGKCSVLAILCLVELLKHLMAHFCSTCRNLHVLCTHFAITELSPYLREALIYFNVMPYGVIKMNRKGYTHKTHKLTNTCLPQVWSTADCEGLLRIERKMPSYPAGQTGSCWAAIWMLNGAHTQKPRHVCVINSQRPEEAKSKHQQRASAESICKTAGQAITHSH